MKEYKLELTDEEFDLLQGAIFNVKEDALKYAVKYAKAGMDSTALDSLKKADEASDIFTKLSKAKWKAIDTEC